MFLLSCFFSTNEVILEKVGPAFFRPSGMRMKQYVPSGVVKLVYWDGVGKPLWILDFSNDFSFEQPLYFCFYCFHLLI